MPSAALVSILELHNVLSNGISLIFIDVCYIILLLYWELKLSN